MFRLALVVLVYSFAVSVHCTYTDSVYTIPCSGQGIVYSESNFTSCECFDCFYGLECEKEITNCTVDLTAGNPTVAQQYWEHVEASSASTNSLAYYRSPYQLFGGIIPPSPGPAFEVDKYIRTSIINMHNLVGNVKNPESYWIVYGQGATQLINAAMYSLALLNGKVTPVFAQTPYYNQYQLFAEYNTINTYWNASEAQYEYADDIIEYVTAPNNPTGELRTPFYSQSKNIVHDLVYYWPTWTNVTVPVDYDLMLFSLSKLTGHAGSRFGWALVRDYKVAHEMRNFINLMNIHTSLDTIHRAMQILDTMVTQNGEFFNNIADVMAGRYARLLPLFESQSKFTLESITNPPTWFYLWIKCEESSNCAQVFADAFMKVEDGQLFGASSQYVRIQLTLRSANFEIFLKRLTKLLTSE